MSLFMKQKKVVFQHDGKWTRWFASLVLLMLFSTVMAFAQKEITGKVTDEAGSPVPGVTVVVKGTTTGTITDMDGKFMIRVPEHYSKSLQFSFVGMNSVEVAILDKSTIDVVMKSESLGVEEVVVVGYGTRKKEELTGSISTVSKEQLKISTAPSVVSRMQGQVAGVTVTSTNRPGADATIRIHGIGTINDPNPLYVIDGVPVGPGNNINPGDVESITVLKDASSAAIYGSRGANGVILITTKRGKLNQEPSITFSARSGISRAVNQYDLLNTSQYAEAIWLEAKNTDSAPNHPQYGSGPNPKIPDYILPAGTMAGAASVDPALYNYPDYVIFKANKQGTDWYNEIYRSGVIQEYDLAVSGGGKKSTYSLSANYLDEQGFLKYTEFKRYNFRVNVESQFADWLKVGESLQAIYINENGDLQGNGEGSPISMAYRMQPIIPVYDIMGNFAGTKAPAMGNAGNPVAQLYRARNNNGKYFRGIGNIFGEAKLSQNLTFKTLFGYNVGQWNGKSYTMPTYEASEPNKVAGFSTDSNYDILWNWANTLNYNVTIKDIHKLNIVVGTEAVSDSYQEMAASRSQYFSLSPEYMQLNSGELNKDNSGTGHASSLFSEFGRVNYDLRGKLFFEATLRRDGSSKFGQNNRFGLFPAASAAWELSKESFMSPSAGWLDMLKVKAGWGTSGNDRIDNYQMYSTYSTNNYTAAYDLHGTNTSAVAGFEPSTKGNPDVKWETTKTANIGFNAGMFKNKLTVALDVWQRNTSDMLYRLSVPEVNGLATPPYVNIGEMKNNGLDIEVAYRNSCFGGKFTYNIAATWSHYKNEVVKLSNNMNEVMGYSERQIEYTRATTGKAFPMFYGYKVNGIIQTEAEASSAPKYGSYTAPGHFNYADLNGDGQITMDKDRTYIGDPHPKFTGGLNVDLGYSNWDMNMFFYGSYGNDMINYVSRWIDYGMFNGNLSKDALFRTWGSPYADNATVKLPKLDQEARSQDASTAYIEDGSFLRMKSLRIGYTFPQGTLNRMKMKNLRLYGQVTNLFTITGYGGLDPELDSSGMSMGVDRGAWPTPRQITFGIVLGL